MTPLQKFSQIWSWVGRHWSEIIPVIFILAVIIWFFAVYRRDKFRFLPAIAIARVTIQDSIGRLEVISLLFIGVLMVGIFGFNLFYGNHMMILLDVPAIQAKMAGLTGGTGITLSMEDQQALLCIILSQAAIMFSDAFVAIIAFILSMFLLPNEINRGVVHSILPKPITRGEYLFGKFLGTWIIVVGCFFILAIMWYLIQMVWFYQHLHAGYQLFNPWDFYPVNKGLILILFLFPFKYASLILIIMSLSLRMPEAPAGIIGLLFYAGGHLSSFIYDKARAFDEAGNMFYAFALKYGYWVLPHVAECTVDILDPFSSILQYWDERWGWVWQITIYNLILLWMVSWLFRRRSL